ncbi:hypothetical protein OB2597_08349 [Pseudooceanicola batsensis HTCC2597]|uniref:DUF4386 domain-containing protein n=1 Tax=Pseudooceanicola batsensis (strain ATCC BAA-863 / DSM 15984 / KCTC 12145 / HTCC2597) TaxID=252305 RepID=A3TUE2_PSEBH|nr:DUF4386 family protein [Pseudooceanicola batsensis]EAQ04138.1 hypothetical protein OB2597_08349 [Pseudooceanicola batsensis HTCC2597]
MTLRQAGGLAALTCAATYIVGFSFLVTVLAPLGYGTGESDPAAVAAFIAARPGVLIGWNILIYVVNALALVVLVVTLRRLIAPSRPDAAALTGAIGLIWAALVLGAGMIANVAVERTHALAADPAAAATLWQTLHAVELGLGGGNEIAGGAWILGVSLAARASGLFGRVSTAIGALSGLAGLATVLPPVGELAGVVFGLGAIAWFVAAGLVLLRGRRPFAKEMTA